MNNYSQNRPSLGRIYRQSAAGALHRSAAASIDADLLANAASGVVSDEDRENAISAIANSPIEADLYRLLQALQPSSAELAQDLASHAPARVVVPFKRPQLVQHAPALRSRSMVTRWASFAVAAAVVAAVLVTVPRSFMQASQTSTVAQQQTTGRPAGDEIFRAESGSRMASNRGESNSTSRRGDTIFNSNNVGESDTIFSARFNGS